MLCMLQNLSFQRIPNEVYNPLSENMKLTNGLEVDREKPMRFLALSPKMDSHTLNWLDRYLRGIGT